MVWRVIRRRIVYVVVFSMALFSLVAFRRRETVTIVAGVSNSDLVDCNTKESQFFVEQLCSNFSRGLLSGSYCSRLCGGYQYLKCMGHGVKSHVILVQEGSRSVVLKSMINEDSSEISYFFETAKKTNVYTKKEVAVSVRNALGAIMSADQINTETVDKLTHHYFKECDSNHNGLLSYQEMAICWRLIYSEEYLFGVLLGTYKGIPQVYGTCGDVFAVQYAEEPIFQPLWNSFPLTSWVTRAHMAIALLDVIEEFETTPYGVLYLCDLQASNLAFQKQSDGSYKAYAIDMDISFFEGAMLSILQQDMDELKKCEDDRKCSFFSCHSKCIEGKCSQKLDTSNLQVLCTELLTNKGDVKEGLLHDPPGGVASKLQYLLRRCVHPDKLLYFMKDTLVHSPLHLLKHIRDLLKESVHLS